MINNIVFDGNYIFHKCVGSLKNTTMFYSGLYTLMENTMEKFVNMNTWDNVIFVSDSKKPSWRTELKKDYKGTRTKDEEIDWKFAYETYDQFKKDLKEKYIVFQADHIEGDDWIFFLIRYFNKKNEGVCTISSDKDLHQLIKSDVNREFMNVQLEANLKNSRFFIPEDWKLLYNKLHNKDGKVELFNLNRNIEHINFFNYCRNNYDIIEKNNKEVFFKKILTGDRGDNVPSVHRILTKTGKLRGIGDKTADKVWEHYINIYNDFDAESESDIKNMMESYEVIKKKEFDSTTNKQIYNNIKTNIKMMELSMSSYPDNIKEVIVNKILTRFEKAT